MIRTNMKKLGNNRQILPCFTLHMYKNSVILTTNIYVYMKNKSFTEKDFIATYSSQLEHYYISAKKSFERLNIK